MDRNTTVNCCHRGFRAGLPRKLASGHRNASRVADSGSHPRTACSGKLVAADFEPDPRREARGRPAVLAYTPLRVEEIACRQAAFSARFLYLPLFIAQCYLLAVAGFSPLSNLPGLLFNLCLISAVVILPLVAIAAVTSNFSRMTLVLLGILLSIAAFTALAVRINLASMTLPWETGLNFVVIICFCGAAIASQYSTRKTRASVLLLKSIPVLIFAIGQFFIESSQPLVDRSYPLSTSEAGAPAHFIYSPSGSSGFNNLLTTAARLPRQVSIQVPLDVSGVADRFVVIPDAIKATVETAP